MAGLIGKKNWPKQILKGKIHYILKHITVEPMIALLVIPSTFSRLATQNLNLDKACLVNLKYSEEVCAALRERNTDIYGREDAEVSRLVANMGTWTSLMSVFPVFLVMFAGSWSDRNQKRKLFMVTPIVGEFIGTVSIIICVIFFYQLPMEVSGFVSTFFSNVTGGWTVMFMAVFSYIADITTVEDRTLRIGFLDVLCSCGVPLGTALSGVLVKYAGYFAVYSISGTFYLLGFIYGVFCVKEASTIRAFKRACSNNSDTTIIENMVENKGFNCKEGNLVYFLKDFFVTSHFKETAQVVLAKGSDNRRKRIILLVVVLIVVFGPLYGKLLFISVTTSNKGNSKITGNAVCTALESFATVFVINVREQTQNFNNWANSAANWVNLKNQHKQEDAHLKISAQKASKCIEPLRLVSVTRN